MKIEDGGPAFPISGNASDEDLNNRHLGMSKREVYAKAAMHGLLSNPEGASDVSPESWAKYAFDLADAMLAESRRERAE